MTRRNNVALEHPLKRGAGMYTVKALAEKAGTTVRTVQYYDRIGILPAAGRTDTGYRVYTEEAPEQLRRILALRELGMSLECIRNYLKGGESTRQQILRNHIQALKNELADISGKIEETEMLAGLAQKEK